MSSMLRKKEVLTIITPIPGFIPRQLAIDILHSHSEVITLNPLVLEHKPIKAPRDAASDEFYSTWYEIIERIQYIPGLGKMGSGKISFNGCFHDMPWGLQTHIYAPMNIDLRNKYRIAGNQPGVEPPEQLEMGLAALGAPTDGLYLREDVEIKCNVAMVSFVKAQLKAASKEMVSRIIKKAELLDAGVLHAMIEDGKLKTINPADRSSTMNNTSTGGGLASPKLAEGNTYQNQNQQPLASPRMPYQVPRPVSHQYFGQQPGTPTPQNPHYSSPYGQPPAPQYHQQQQQQPPQHAELPTSPHGGLAPQASLNMPVEMPGDFVYAAQPSPRMQPPQPSPTFNPAQQSYISDRDSAISTQSRQSPAPTAGDWRWSQSQGGAGTPSLGGPNSRPTSISSDATGGGFHSPGLEHQGFASELPTHRETKEEHQNEALRKLDGRGQLPSQQQQQQQQQQKSYAYNPADYAKVGGQTGYPQTTAQRYGYTQ